MLASGRETFPDGLDEDFISRKLANEQASAGTAASDSWHSDGETAGRIEAPADDWPSESGSAADSPAAAPTLRTLSVPTASRADEEWGAATPPSPDPWAESAAINAGEEEAADARTTLATLSAKNQGYASSFERAKVAYAVLQPVRSSAEIDPRTGSHFVAPLHRRHAADGGERVASYEARRERRWRAAQGEGDAGAPSPAPPNPEKGRSISAMLRDAAGDDGGGGRSELLDIRYEDSGGLPSPKAT